VLAVAGSAPVFVPAPQVEVQDTTGAGDAFCGAFLSSWLCAGFTAAGFTAAGFTAAAGSLTEAAAFAVRTAATAVTTLGGRPRAAS
jgi:sugar/nucleoside kinase (ribokinase family)